MLAAVVRDQGRQTYQAQVSELKVREADLDYRIARVRLLPKFGASAGYSLENTTNASATTVSQQGVARQTIAVGAQWNIFDGFASRAAKRAALVTKRGAELELKTASEAAVDAAQGLMQQLELDVQAMEMSALRLGLASEELKKVGDEFKLGNVPQTAVDQTTSGLKVMEFQNANARATFLARWSEFASLVGADPVLTQLPARHDSEKR
jgi:outer membrane protein TolC